jgi:hypothetical protein
VGLALLPIGTPQRQLERDDLEEAAPNRSIPTGRSAKFSLVPFFKSNGDGLFCLGQTLSQFSYPVPVPTAPGLVFAEAPRGVSYKPMS